ncbi:MAG: histidine kinase dimerization/phospho-acceptor domain-containing protein [Pseudomonadota bacterium]
MTVRVGIEALEDALGSVASPIFVTDEAGVVIIPTLPALRLTTSRLIEATYQSSIAESRKYDLDAMSETPLRSTGTWGSNAPLMRFSDREIMGRSVTFLQQTSANRLLATEVEERKATEANLRQTQGELIQAGKLAAFGQMSAALSHEFNQPLTAIRTYSENAAAFFDAGRPEKAKDNLSRVLRLTEKMAQLSRHLTGFARQSTTDVLSGLLTQVVSEALALLQARIETYAEVLSSQGRRT